MTDKLGQALESPCRHEWYQRECVHCGIAVGDFRAALAAAPAPQPAPDREALVEALRAQRQADADGVMVTVSRQAVEEAISLIAAAPAPEPAPADREALVEVIRRANDDWIANQSKPTSRPDAIANALIADGWRKPTDAQPETLAWAVLGEPEEDTEIHRIYKSRLQALYWAYDNGFDLTRVAPVAIRAVDSEADAGRGGTE